MTEKVPLLTLRIAKPGVELILNQLAELPYRQAGGLIKEIEAQANMQLEMMQIAAETARKQAAAETTNETEGETEQ